MRLIQPIYFSLFFAAVLRPSTTTPIEPVNLPLSFEANHGQFDPGVMFASRGPGYTVKLTSHSAVLTMEGVDARRAEMTIGFSGGGRPSAIEGANALRGKVNYLHGRNPAAWRTGVPTYGKVIYHDVYDGIDLIYYGSRQRLEYDLAVRPGVNPQQIRLHFGGLSGLRLTRDGDLLLSTPAGDMIQHRPFVYQEGPATRRTIKARYMILEQDVVGFKIGRYDKKRSLIIDPNISYSARLAPATSYTNTRIAVDSAGNTYLAGSTESTGFPTTAGALQLALRSAQDAFVMKISADGSTLIYSTYLGGNLEDYAAGIAVDSAGNAYVAGTTDSTDFPVTAGAYQPAPVGSSQDVFLAKLNPDGSALIYSTYLGGTGADGSTHLAIDSSGNAYITGATLSPDFPVTSGAFQTVLHGIQDAFVTKVNASGSALVYSTFLGGSLDDYGYRIAVDSTGAAYVAGVTASRNFPVTPGVLGTSMTSTIAFVTKLNPQGTGLVYSTYLGNPASTQAYGLATDAAGNAYITGWSDPGFPVTPNAYQADGMGPFVAKLDSTATHLIYGTYLGGPGNATGYGIAVDRSGSAWVTGSTYQPFPVTSDAIQSTQGNFTAAFLTGLNGSGSALVYSTLLAGFSGNNEGQDIAISPSGRVHIAGSTDAQDFPVTSGSLSWGSGETAVFAASFDPATSCNFSISSNGVDLGFDAATGSVEVTAPAGCNWFTLNNSDFITVASGGSGKGSGTLAYSVSANAGPPRSGSLIIAGQTFTVTQPLHCVYSLPVNQAFVDAYGGFGYFLVDTAYLCSWDFVGNADWIRTEGNSGAAQYYVLSNTSPDVRTGTMTAAGLTFTLTQAGAPCGAYAIDPMSQIIPGEGGTYTVNVTAAPGCSWVGVTTDPEVQFSTALGTGSGTAAYTVAPTAGSGRLAYLTIAYQTLELAQFDDPMTDPTSFVMQLYLDLLSRVPDGSGLDFWSNELKNSTATKGEVAQSFFSSPEFAGNGTAVFGAYLAILGRDPDFGGWNYWNTELQQHLTRPLDILTAFLSSPEYQRKFGSPDDGAFVTQLYENALHRSPDGPGLSYWTGQLSSGTMTRQQVAQALISSLEFVSQSTNQIDATMLYFGFLRRNPDSPGLPSGWDSSTRERLCRA